MGPPRILIDTGAIFAFVTRTDTHHEAAKRFVREWLDQGMPRDDPRKERGANRALPGEPVV